jgi:phosphohistidine phosphatase SixA
LKVIRETSNDVQNLTIVGHNPGIWSLAKEICSVDKSSSATQLKEELPTPGLVVIDINAKNWRYVEAESGKLIKFVAPDML